MTDMLNGRYELGEVVGSGGMGAVHRAVDTRLGRTVAVKVLRDGPVADETARLRMRSEANLAASINHPGVAQVYDLGDDTVSGRSQTFLVMQFIEGHTLAQLLRERGPMAPQQVMSVVVQVAEGLQAAHDAGIVHRDLKPANIMLTPAGRTVLVDFGIARSDTSEPLTSTGAMIGTADYMSPEQVRGRPATPRSDLYALGIVAHQCLTGQSPFRRDSHIATAMAQLHEELPPLGPDVPPAVTELIASLTSKDASDRPSTAAAVVVRAASIGADRAIELPPTFEMPDVTIPTAVQAPPSTSSTSGRPAALAPRRARQRRAVAVYAGVGALMVAVAVLGVQLFPSGDPVAVPDVVGMTVAEATTQVRGAGMTAVPEAVDVAGKQKGLVVDQSPKPGRLDASDGRVRLSVSSGKVAVAASELIGQSYADASATLERLGLEVERADVAQSTSIGQVVALDRSGRLPDGSTVTLSVAVAPANEPTAAAPVVSEPADVAPDAGTSKGKGNGKTKGKTKGKG